MMYHNICPTYVCKGRTQQHPKKILCHACQTYVHCSCPGLLLGDFETALSNGNYFSRLCIKIFFLPYNHVDGDDNKFMKCIKTTSHSPEVAAFRHHNVNIFHPFNINEDDNDIIEYHGDIDPEKMLLQWISHILIKSCNYYTENASNKYMLQHYISGSSFSVLHLNIRSKPANLSAFLAYNGKLDHCFFCHWIVRNIVESIYCFSLWHYWI